MGEFELPEEGITGDPVNVGDLVKLRSFRNSARVFEFTGLSNWIGSMEKEHVGLVLGFHRYNSAGSIQVHVLLPNNLVGWVTMDWIEVIM